MDGVENPKQNQNKTPKTPSISSHLISIVMLNLRLPQQESVEKQEKYAFMAGKTQTQKKRGITRYLISQKPPQARKCRIGSGHRMLLP